MRKKDTKPIEKANSDKMAVIDDKNRCRKKQESIATTNSFFGCIE
jgi:hypothetical protein